MHRGNLSPSARAPISLELPACIARNARKRLEHCRLPLAYLSYGGFTHAPNAQWDRYIGDCSGSSERLANRLARNWSSECIRFCPASRQKRQWRYIPGSSDFVWLDIPHGCWLLSPVCRKRRRPRVRDGVFKDDSFYWIKQKRENESCLIFAIVLSVNHSTAPGPVGVAYNV